MEAFVNADANSLANSFGRITTQDPESLILDFMNILRGSNVLLDKETCVFFLDMNNWSLPAALNSFYDYNAQDLLNVPKMSLLKIHLADDDQTVSVNSTFRKTWRLFNPGSEAWPEGCTLKKLQGNEISCSFDKIFVTSAKPGEYVDVTVQLTSCSSPGVYHSAWQLLTNNGLPFGDVIWLIITIEDDSITEITHRLAESTMDDDHKPSVASSRESSFPDSNDANYDPLASSRSQSSWFPQRPCCLLNASSSKAATVGYCQTANNFTAYADSSTFMDNEASS